MAIVAILAFLFPEWRQALGKAGSQAAREAKTDALIGGLQRELGKLGDILDALVKAFQAHDRQDAEFHGQIAEHMAGSKSAIERIERDVAQLRDQVGRIAADAPPARRRGIS